MHPEGKTLRLLIRAPLKSMRDVDVPAVAGGFLDFSKMPAAEQHAAQVWIRDFVEVYENGQQLTVPVIAATRTSLPSDRSFESYDAALANITTGAKLDQSAEIYWDQGMLDVLFEYPIQSDQSDFAIRPGLTRLGIRVNVGLRFLQPGKPERVFDVHADTGIVHLDPRWHQAFYLFAREGFFHILDGIDHLLFLLCLVIPFRRFRSLVVVVTAFTVAHSVTLIASAYGMAPGSLWFPPLIETLIAISILYMAFENIVGAKLERRWVDDVRVRVDPRLRVFVPAARAAAVCRRAPGGVAARVQRRGRDRPAAGAGDHHPGAGADLPLRRGGANRHDPDVGARRAHRVALGNRARRPADAVSLDGDRTVGCRRVHATGDGDRRRRLPDVADVTLDRRFLTAAPYGGSSRGFCEPS